MTRPVAPPLHPAYEASPVAGELLALASGRLAAVSTRLPLCRRLVTK